MSYKLWVTRICVVLAVFLLFIPTPYVLHRLRIEFAMTFSMHWGFFGLSVLLLIIPGVLLGISPEVFFNLRNVRLSPREFIVLAVIPIIVLVYLVGQWSMYWSLLALRQLPDFILNFITFYFYTDFALITSSIWIGVAIGKACHIRQ